MMVIDDMSYRMVKYPQGEMITLNMSDFPNMEYVHIDIDIDIDFDRIYYGWEKYLDDKLVRGKIYEITIQYNRRDFTDKMYRFYYKFENSPYVFKEIFKTEKEALKFEFLEKMKGLG